MIIDDRQKVTSMLRAWMLLNTVMASLHGIGDNIRLHAAAKDGVIQPPRPREPATPIVLHVIPELTGGAGRGAVELVHAINAYGQYRAHLCVLGRPPDERLLDELPPETTFLGCAQPNSQINVDCWRRLRQEIVRSKPKILHLHLWPAVSVVAMAMLGRKIPTIVHIRDTPPSFRLRDLRSAFLRIKYRLALRILRAQCIAVSTAAARHVITNLRVSANQVRIILNGIDLNRFENCAPRPTGKSIIIGAAGRLSSEKGHAFLIDAVAKLREEGLPVKLKLAGDGSLHQELQQRAICLRIEEHVEFSGPVSNMAGFYRNLDVFVLPSLREGLSRVLLEAMACDVPCVATDCEGTSDVIVNGENGLIVPRGDVNALTEALRRLVGDASLRTALARSGQELMRRRFSLERVCREVLDSYRELLGQPHRSSVWRVDRETTESVG